MIPALAWVPSYSNSLGGALGVAVSHDIMPTVNPLKFKVRFHFGEELSGEKMLHVWNLFQKYAAANDAIPQGKLEKEGTKMTVEVVVRRRMGLPKDSHPLG